MARLGIVCTDQCSEDPVQHFCISSRSHLLFHLFSEVSPIIQEGPTGLGELIGRRRVLQHYRLAEARVVVGKIPAQDWYHS